MQEHTERFRGALKSASRPKDRLPYDTKFRFRDALEAELEQAIMAKESVLIVGEAGDGKTSLIASVDKKLRKSKSRKILSFSANEIQAGCV